MTTPMKVPSGLQDVLAPNLRVVFCGTIRASGSNWSSLCKYENRLRSDHCEYRQISIEMTRHFSPWRRPYFRLRWKVHTASVLWPEKLRFFLRPVFHPFWSIPWKFCEAGHRRSLPGGSREMGEKKSTEL